MERKTDFFKVLIGDFEQRLRIPLAFVKQISQESSEVAIIEGPSGSCWHVKLNKITNDVYLQDGWEEFSSAHSLRLGEFLVFKHCGNMHFKVKIFDKSTCEREDAFMVKCSQEAANRHGIKRQRRWKSSLELKHLSNHSKKHKKDCILEQKYPRQSDQSDSHQGEKGPVLKPDRIVVTKGIEAKEAAYSFTSSFPYFVIQMKQYNVGLPFQVTIPAHFARSHFRSVPEKVALRNHEGKMWMVNFHFYPSSRQHSLFGGWRAFSHANNLKNGDYCVFELVHELDMQVHIFRVRGQMSCYSVGLKEETHKPSEGKGWRIYRTRSTISSAPFLSEPGQIMITKGMEAKEAAYSFTSFFPYFVVQMKRNNVGPPFHLTIPVHFARLHFPRVSSKVALQNQEGKIWLVNLKFYPARNQHLLFGGWRAFLRAHNLKIGDYCVFELGHELHMQVHIFRIGSQMCRRSSRLNTLT